MMKNGCVGNTSWRNRLTTLYKHRVTVRGMIAVFLSSCILCCASCMKKNEYELPYGKHPLQKLDVYSSSKKKAPIVVLIHGGAWVSGDKMEYFPLAHTLQQEGYTVVNLNYRLVPEALYPAQSEDVACAITWVKTHAVDFRGDSAKVALIGFSAGAHLAALHALRADDAWLPACLPNISSEVDGVIAVGGVYDFFLSPASLIDPYIRSMIGDSATNWEDAQPIVHANKNTSTRFLLLAAHDDDVVGHFQARIFQPALSLRGQRSRMEEFEELDHTEIISQHVKTSPVVQSMLRFLEELWTEK